MLKLRADHIPETFATSINNLFFLCDIGYGNLKIKNILNY